MWSLNGDECFELFKRDEMGRVYHWPKTMLTVAPSLVTDDYMKILLERLLTTVFLIYNARYTRENRQSLHGLLIITSF